MGFPALGVRGYAAVDGEGSSGHRGLTLTVTYSCHIRSETFPFRKVMTISLPP